MEKLLADKNCLAARLRVHAVSPDKVGTEVIRIAISSNKIKGSIAVIIFYIKHFHLLWLSRFDFFLCSNLSTEAIEASRSSLDMTPTCPSVLATTINYDYTGWITQFSPKTWPSLHVWNEVISPYKLCLHKRYSPLSTINNLSVGASFSKMISFGRLKGKTFMMQMSL